MDTPQISAPSRAPSSGVVHIDTRHTGRFTVVGNHLAQHRELSLVAIGLAAHIQSLPDGARIGIKPLADRFPESEARIAAALRELEAHGYLKRIRERLPSGRVVTRTVSYNQPLTGTRSAAAPQPQPQNRPTPESGPRPRPVRPVPAPRPETVTPAPAPSAPTPAPAPETPKTDEPAPAPAPPRPPLPRPQAHDLDRHRVAVELLADLRRHESRLLLGEADIRRLAPAVAAWLERDARPDVVRRTLVADLPESLTRPAGLLAHRLTALLPPPLPTAPADEAAPRRDPLQNCDGCDRAFRAPEPGHCRECRTDLKAAA
ncbi:helix-turn-helix domain-containing protein [Streptomyces sp. NBC_01768]|uniref:helix-turn-helix domain-containing protein n=1 Tax=Streptomyces sp. NBC_01768 TaxID=2975938 RepID=UPI002DD9D8B9|nr:helix-turn-helix domain-containing protein [Streptomyces sp. NBC_01768]WSC28459.1 helix-turn-helix domain-containing protein [Streptomyces sp. NBC_01768]